MIYIGAIFKCQVDSTLDRCLLTIVVFYYVQFLGYCLNIPSIYSLFSLIKQRQREAVRQFQRTMTGVWFVCFKIFHFLTAIKLHVFSVEMLYESRLIFTKFCLQIVKWNRG